MHVSHGLRHLMGLSLTVALLGNGLAWSQQPGTPVTAGGQSQLSQSQLRWTPHRAATSTEVAATDSAPASPSSTKTATAQATATPTGGMTATAPATTQAVVAAAPSPITSPPASVGLPDGVPAVAAAPRRRVPQNQPPAPRRTRPAGQMGDWRSDNRVPGRFSANSTNNGQMTLPSMGAINMGDINVFRSPQGDAGRPVLAVEGTPRRPNTAPAVAPLGGGLAPRFNATAGRPTGQRADRLAMNPDGLPSVMARAPQAAAIDDGSMPGRLPTAGMANPVLPTPSAPQAIMTSEDPSIIINTTPSEMMEMGPDAMGGQGYGGEFTEGAMSPEDGGMWMGDYPTQLHVESFYDDPFACEESAGFLSCWPSDGRVCAWLRQFGKPYYGWRWYRDFSAGAGITAFQNQSNFGLLGNYGTNEYVNWAMPFWNAFGLGWQIGARGVQTNFQQPTISDGLGKLRGNSRDQVFVTTGFFTRAFEGRGLQGGAVYDYLSDSYFENVDVAQIRGELSYVWGYHELGFWGAFNSTEQKGSFSPAGRSPGMASTVDLYTAFYRLHFGDANEVRIWGGASGNAQGVVGSTVRAPMSRSLALEGTFTYLLPDKSQTVQLDPTTSVTFAPSAWNLSANLVWYPAGRARRGLASPYRPLFDVADNGSMIRALSRLPTP